MQELVSVIIPVYNTEKYVAKCIESVVNQTYSNIEIIIVDDGSSDKSGFICDRFASIDNRITVIHNENSGLSAARNTGLDKAKGSYICFVDSDDSINSEYVDRMLTLALEKKAQIVQCDFLCTDINSILLNNKDSSTIKTYRGHQVLKKYCCDISVVRYTICCNKLYYYELFNDIRFPIGKQHEDEFISYKLLYKADVFVETSEYLYYYLQRNDSIMGKGFSYKSLDGITALKERLLFLDDLNLNEEYKSTKEKLLRQYRVDYKLMKQYYPHDTKTIDLIAREYKNLSGMEITEEMIRQPIRFSINKFTKYFTYKWALYGAGSMGQYIYNNYKTTNNKDTLQICVDNFWYTYKELSFSVKPVDRIMGADFDYIIVAVKNPEDSLQIRKNLIAWGINEEKIVMP